MIDEKQNPSQCCGGVAITEDRVDELDDAGCGTSADVQQTCTRRTGKSASRHPVAVGQQHKL